MHLNYDVNDHINQYHFLQARSHLCIRFIVGLLEVVRLVFRFTLISPSEGDFDGRYFPSLSPYSPTILSLWLLAP